MKLSAKHKAAIKSYLRAVAASGITVALAIVADIHPAYATLLVQLSGLLSKQLIQNRGAKRIMVLAKNDSKRNNWHSRWRMRRINKFISGSALGY
jgi:hypothetical protein